MGSDPCYRGSELHWPPYDLLCGGAGPDPRRALWAPHGDPVSAPMSYYEWSHQSPPHGRNPVFFDGPCPCEDCEQYHAWVEYAEELGDP